MEQDLFSIISEKDDVRLDVFLSEQMNGFSRSRLSSLIKEGLFCVGGRIIKKPAYKIKSGEVVDGVIPPTKELDLEPVDIDIDIVYEDKSIIIVNKPKNMVVHPAPGHFNDTLVNALLYHMDGKLSSINGIARPGIVHRIDKDTTGLLVVAKTDEAHLNLSEQMKNHSIKREYEAIVFGSIKDDEVTVNEPIGRHHKDRLRMSVNKTNGREAVTHLKVLERFPKYTYIRAILETGRTHQIRVHLAHIGFPVLGDTVYSSRKQPFNLQGQALHAKTLGFIHPETNEFVIFESELPEYFKHLIEISKEVKSV